MVRLTDHPDMTLDVYGGRKTTNDIYLRNELHFSEVYGSVNYIGSGAK